MADQRTYQGTAGSSFHGRTRDFFDGARDADDRPLQDDAFSDSMFDAIRRSDEVKVKSIVEAEDPDPRNVDAYAQLLIKVDKRDRDGVGIILTEFPHIVLNDTRASTLAIANGGGDILDDLIKAGVKLTGDMALIAEAAGHEKLARSLKDEDEENLLMKLYKESRQRLSEELAKVEHRKEDKALMREVLHSLGADALLGDLDSPYGMHDHDDAHHVAEEAPKLQSTAPEAPERGSISKFLRDIRAGKLNDALKEARLMTGDVRDTAIEHVRQNIKRLKM